MNHMHTAKQTPPALPCTLVMKGNPITKKNHQQIRRNWSTGKPFIAQSDAYQQYERDCGWFLRPLGISRPVNVQCVYYMESQRRVDLGNLIAATCDILVKHRVLTEDNRNIVAGHDGSRVLYDKRNPRVEITITAVENYTVWGE